MVSNVARLDVVKRCAELSSRGRRSRARHRSAHRPQPRDHLEQAMIGAAAALVALTLFASRPGSGRWMLDLCWLLVLVCAALGVWYCSPRQRRARADRERRTAVDFLALADYLDQHNRQQEATTLQEGRSAGE